LVTERQALSYFDVTMKCRVLILSMLCLGMLASSGCAYFRWNEPNYDELHQRSQQQKESDQMNYAPGNRAGSSKP
jgi:hypothetical protein